MKRLVEMHAGTVEAHSEGPGRGSEFVVRLPAARGPGTAEAGPEVAPAAAAARRVLVVDDNVDAADSLGALLGLMGHQVAYAYDGPAAVKAARAFRPDAALLDIGLPGMNGYEVARRIRAEPGLGPTLLVAISSWGQDEDRRRSHEAGFDHHLIKPADVSSVQRLLADLPGRSG